MVGDKDTLGAVHVRFKSCPAKLQRLLPVATPSGFNMGTILKTAIFLNRLATSLPPHKKEITPSIM
jgi:hypothetical protein